MLPSCRSRPPLNRAALSTSNRPSPLRGERMHKSFRLSIAATSVRPASLFCAFRDLLGYQQIVAANDLPLELTGSPRRHIYNASKMPEVTLVRKHNRFYGFCRPLRLTYTPRIFRQIDCENSHYPKQSNTPVET